MRIAGKRTDAGWKKLRCRLESKPSPKLWDKAFKDFYLERIKTRYFNPIASIERHDKELGEGFAISALFCTLIEFLESCEKGDNFHFIGKTGERLSPHEYSERQASRYFKDFFKTRKPFDTLVPSALIDSFYQNVRCGLLHEARTKGGWLISSEAPKGILLLKNGDEITLFRRQIVPALKMYFADYRSRLRANDETQQAFKRKFDHLCNR